MNEEDRPQPETLETIGQRLKRIEAKFKKAPWLALAIFGGTLIAISLPYWLDTGALVIAGVGLLLAVLSMLFYYEPWKKP